MKFDLTSISTGLMDFNKVTTPERILELLAELFSNENALMEVAEHSYLHDNGFYKIVLGQHPDTKAKLRLHLWDSSLTTFTEDMNVHNHRWRLSSKVLHGKALHQIFKESTEDGEDYTEYAYSHLTFQNAYSLVHSSQKRLQIVEEGILVPGVAYTLEPEVLHRMFPISDCFLTVVCHDAPTRTSTSVLTNNKEPVGSGKIDALSLIQLKDLISRCQELIASGLI